MNEYNVTMKKVRDEFGDRHMFPETRTFIMEAESASQLQEEIYNGSETHKGSRVEIIKIEKI